MQQHIGYLAVLYPTCIKLIAMAVITASSSHRLSSRHLRCRSRGKFSWYVSVGAARKYAKSPALRFPGYTTGFVIPAAACLRTMLLVRLKPALTNGLGSVALLRSAATSLLPKAAAVAAVWVAAVASPAGASILREVLRCRQGVLLPLPLLPQGGCRRVDGIAHPPAAACTARVRASRRNDVLQWAYVASFMDMTIATTVSTKLGIKLDCRQSMAEDGTCISLKWHNIGLLKEQQQH